MKPLKDILPNAAGHRLHENSEREPNECHKTKTMSHFQWGSQVYPFTSHIIISSNVIVIISIMQLNIFKCMIFSCVVLCLCFDRGKEFLCPALLQSPPSVQLHNTGCRGADTPCVELHQMLGLLHSFNNGVHHQEYFVSCNEVDCHYNLDTLCPLNFNSVNWRWIGYLKCKNKLFVVTSPQRMTPFLPNTYRAFELLSPHRFGFMAHNFTAFVQFHCSSHHGAQMRNQQLSGTSN